MTDPQPQIHKLIRSQRRTLALQVTQSAELIVRAPFRMDEVMIWKYVRQKANWIQRKQDEFRRRAAIQPKQFETGEEFHLLGRPLTLKVLDQDEDILIVGDELRIRTQIASNRRTRDAALATWYKYQAEKTIYPRVAAMAARTNLSYKDLRITSAKSRWGSCGPDKRICFSWRLVMAPIEVIDYVIAHELAHLAHPNHSPKFWAKVHEILPDFRDRLNQLKKMGPSLIF